MKQKPRLRLSILALIMLAMMSALIFQLGNLTLAEGETYAAEADKRSNKTMYTTNERGRILDRNGIPLAYDQTSYNVQFSRDPERRDSLNSALYTEALIKAIQIIEDGGGTIIDTSYIRMDENGVPVYKWGVESEEAIFARYKNFCEAMSFAISEADKDDMTKWRSAPDAYLYLRQTWKIPDDMPFEDAVKIMSIRQEVNLNQWRAYEPVTIAYNVSMEVVAQLEMYASELPGISTTKSTSRIYPWGTTAAHIIGYLSRQVSDEMSEPDMQTMGYTQEEYEDYIVKDKNSDANDALNQYGNRMVRMTRLGYQADDYIGVAGIEKTMEKYLTASTSDKRGKTTVETNMSGVVMRELERTGSTSGSDVMLTIDLPLQQVTEAALEKAITQMNAYEQNLLEEKLDDYQKQRSDVSTIKMAETGSIVVLDVNTGKVLAMASYPTFDPNIFMQGAISTETFEALYGKDSKQPTLNRAIASRLAPGSIFKMATGLAGLMEGVITPETRVLDGHIHEIDSNGQIRPTSKTTENGKYTNFFASDEIKVKDAPGCWSSASKHAGLNMNISTALAQSCNYYFFTVADAIGISRLNSWSSRLGLDSSTDIELPGELTSHVGGQEALYDNTKTVEQQKSSLPSYIKRKLVDVLKRISDEREPSAEELDRCARRILELQSGYGTSQEFGDDIRRILREELQIPVTISKVNNWSNEISSMLNELLWKPVMSVRAGIGQGITLTTPIAIARYAAAFANGGTVYDVHIVDRILSSSGSVEKVFEPSVHDKIDAPEEYWNAILTGLEGVVSVDDNGVAGTAAKDIFTPEFAPYLEKIVGKSGTAQISSADNNIDIENTSWFVTMLPRDNPEIVIITCIPNGFSGARGGGPAVEEIVRFYIDRKEGSAKENLVDINGLIP